MNNDRLGHETYGNGGGKSQDDDVLDLHDDYVCVCERVLCLLNCLERWIV